jgi:hypothetical protein
LRFNPRGRETNQRIFSIASRNNRLALSLASPHEEWPRHMKKLGQNKSLLVFNSRWLG